MTNTGKTVDVVMCTYNGEKFLREQLDSIVAQTYPIHRLIVQDDGSTDSTVEIVREYAARHPFIELYVNGRNLGFNLNFKTAVMRATADFVAIADQDDVWFADKIERQVSQIGDHNICFAAHLRGASLNAASKVEPQYSLKALLFGGFAGHTMLLRRTFAQREEAWAGAVIYDWSLAVSAYFCGTEAITYISDPLNWHRSHDGEAALRLHQTRAARLGAVAGGALAPYLHGLRHYRRLQGLDKWRRFYTFILNNTATPRYRTEHTMARCLLSPGLLPLLRLCLICLRYRKEAYPAAASARGVMGLLRGFFLPLIFAYNNTEFDD